MRKKLEQSIRIAHSLEALRVLRGHLLEALQKKRIVEKTYTKLLDFWYKRLDELENPVIIVETSINAEYGSMFKYKSERNKEILLDVKEGGPNNVIKLPLKGAKTGKLSA